MGSIAKMVADLEAEVKRLRSTNLDLIEKIGKAQDETVKVRELMIKLEANYQRASKDRSRIQLKYNALKKKLTPEEETP